MNSEQLTVNGECSAAGEETVLSLLSGYADKRPARFHMPGHKGVLPAPFDTVAPIDVTELRGTGDLYYEADGVIRASERAMAALYGAEDCFYLTGGSTQGIFSMLAAATRPGGTVYADRYCHRSVVNAFALLDLHPVWLRRDTIEPWGIPGGFISAAVPGAPLIYTSPTYHGIMAAPLTERGQHTGSPIPADTDGNSLLLCDAAHGAHLPFITENYHPPGNLWVVSAHKTLGALGQTAFILSDGSVDADLLREQTSVFGTASPSFVLLASLDAAREELVRNGRESWKRVTEFTSALTARDERILPGADPAKITIYTGDGIGDAERLERDFGVVCEMCDTRNIVFMLSPHNTDEDFFRLENALTAIPKRTPLPPYPNLQLPDVSCKLSIREAFFAPRERIPLRNSAGRIAARIFAPSPPGTLVLAPGERFDKLHLEILEEMCYTMDEPVWVVA